MGIKEWREAAMLTQAQMADEFEMPKRTLENWEEGSRQPSAWVEKLIIEKLMRITEEKYEAKAKKVFNTLKKDEDGNRPEIAWIAEEIDGNNCCVWRYNTMADAINDAEDGMYICCRNVNKGKADSYMDEDGNICEDYFSFKWEKWMKDYL